jgi:hypothetical protein
VIVVFFRLIHLSAGAMIRATPIRFVSRKAHKKAPQYILHKIFNADQFYWVSNIRNEIKLWHLEDDPTIMLPIMITDNRTYQNYYSPVEETYPGESFAVTEYVLDHLKFTKIFTSYGINNIFEKHLDRCTFVNFTSTCKANRKYYNRPFAPNMICKLDPDTMGLIFNSLDVNSLGRFSKSSKDCYDKIVEITGVCEKMIILPEIGKSRPKIPDIDNFKIDVWGSLTHLIRLNISDFIFGYLDLPDVMNLFSLNTKVNMRMKMMRAQPNVMTKISFSGWSFSTIDPNFIPPFCPTLVYSPPPPITIESKKCFSHTTVTQIQHGESIIYNGTVYCKKTLVEKSEKDKRYYTAKTRGLRHRYDSDDDGHYDEYRDHHYY